MTGLVACKAAGLALGYALTLIKGIKGGMHAVAIVWKTLTIAFAANSVGVVVTALLIITNWEKVKKFFTAIWNKIKPIWKKFANLVKEFWNTISDPVKAIGGLWNKFFEDKKSKEAKLDAESEKVIKDATGEPLKSEKNVTSNKTQNNNFTININGQDYTDPEKIKREIEKLLNSKDDEFLFDKAEVS